MNWFLIFLAIGLASSDKLDRTYLPPIGAQFSGGILGSHDAPLEPPHHLHPGLETTITKGPYGNQPNIGLNGESFNFGDKIPQVPFNYYQEKFPTTTTSYAFSQTTTYPPVDGFETTALPINPVTGLPIQLEQGNNLFGPQGQQNIQKLPNYTQNQETTYGTIRPDFVPGSKNQFANQPINQYSGQNVITTGNDVQTPGRMYQQPGQKQGELQYPGQDKTEQRESVYTGAPDNQRVDQYPRQDVVYPGGIVQIPGGNQALTQYPSEQTTTGQPGSIPSTASPTNLQTGGNQYGISVSPNDSQGPKSQGTYSGQPINVQNFGESQPTQTPYQNQESLNVATNPAQYPTINQNYDTSRQGESGSTPSTIPSLYYDGVSSTTSLPKVPQSTSVYPSVNRFYRPERPQAAADRNAVILNYENVRTPNGYSYSFDTSNGIHADESGIVDNGTKAQGSYSYIGDDGKIYSVIYTADENGFQPRGDHLPTPPPIPEAIQKVIEQAAKDKLAGIFDDGSYDEAKYGDKKYLETANRHRPQNQHKGRFNNKNLKGGKNDLISIKPIAGIKDEEYDEVQFNDNVSNTEHRKSSKLPSRPMKEGPSSQIDNKNKIQNIPEPTKTVLGDGDVLLGSVDQYGRPGIKQFYDNDTKKQGSTGYPPIINEDNFPRNEVARTDTNNAAVSKNRESTTPGLAPGEKYFTDTKYPGSHVDVSGESIPNGVGSNEGQDTNSSRPGFSDGQNINMYSRFNTSSTAPIVTNRKQMMRQKMLEKESNEYNKNQNNRPKVENKSQVNTETPSISDYINNAAKDTVQNQQQTQKDDKGYYYQQPNSKFEQNTFPTRFSPQEVSSTRKPDQLRDEYVQGTTRKPFITPNIYDKNEYITNKTPQSTSRRPFMTIRVTSPTDNSYTDYENGQDYATDQDIGDDRIYSNTTPAENNGINSRPYQPTQTTSSRVNQKDYVTPGQRTIYSETVTPGYFYQPTTPMLSHNSRFGSNEIPRRISQQTGPSTTVIDSTTGFVRPVTTQSSSEKKPSDYEYQTTNVGSDYPATGFGSISTTPGVSLPQNYYSSTYRPSQEYFSTSALPPTPGLNSNNDKPASGSTRGSLQPSQDNSFHTGYHYGPPKYDHSVTDLFNPDKSRISGVTPTLSTENYQTSSRQGPGDYPSTTSTPARQDTFIQPDSSPYPTYQGQNQNGPSDYPIAITSTTPVNKSVFKYPGSTVSSPQETTDYENGPSRNFYPSTESSTLGTTPSSYVPSITTGPAQGYSTTYRPAFQTTKDTFVGSPTVDGFGRPIITEQGGSYPGFIQPTKGPISNIGPNFDGIESTSYPETYVKSSVVGEDFSGPKQPQRYDPKTGYHY